VFSERFQELDIALSSCIYSTPSGEISEEMALELTHQKLFETKDNNGIVYVIGNGGSAGIASHFSTDLMRTLGLASQTLYDSNLITCLSNDLGYENVFSYQLLKLLKPSDLLIAISSSGKSPNILRAVEAASTKSTPVITLSGFSKENPLRKTGLLNFWIDSFDYGLVETTHFFQLHTVIDYAKNTIPHPVGFREF
jgi:D-sedoheptulose 7-phosphate isomerase